MQKTPKEMQMKNGEKKGCVVVSIHDVSPRTRERTQVILADLRSLGVKTASLLVISNHHHTGLISEDHYFSQWLREKCEEGHEAVVHGFYHQRKAVTRDGACKRLITTIYTAGEGEFYDLEEKTAAERLAAARGEFEKCGVKYCGFIAPAWLLGMAAERAVRQAGFDYTTRLTTVSDFRDAKIYKARSLVWSVRAGWRRFSSLTWNRMLFQCTAQCPLLRISLHPPDWDYPLIRRQILQIVSGALAARNAMTYQSWLACQRAIS